MTGAYYNEHDRGAAAWLRELIRQGQIAPGDVDERSIEEVTADDVRGYTQCHFFAGIGGWSHALRLAGWPDDRPVWTGSCPCQPFSAAGRRRGTADERHLWPVWAKLVAAIRPGVIFGEQVASPPGLAWLDLVCADLEGAGYAVGAADLCAAGAGASHIRQRMYFVAHTDVEGLAGRTSERCDPGEERSAAERGGGGGSGLADAGNAIGWANHVAGEDGHHWEDGRRVEAHRFVGARSEVRGLADAADAIWRAGECGVEAGTGEGSKRGRGPAIRCVARRLGHSDGAGRETCDGVPGGSGEGSRQFADPSPLRGLADAVPAGRAEWRAESGGGSATGSGGDCFWSSCEWIPCRDGKSRPTQPGVFPLANGIPARVGRLRGYGNAIVAPLAAEFVRAVMEVTT